MFGGRNRGAEVSEGLAALEVRLARLATEVQSEVARVQGEVARLAGKVDALEAREVARVAALQEATGKYIAAAERARKLGALGTNGSGDADYEAYARVADARRAALGIG